MLQPPDDPSTLARFGVALKLPSFPKLLLPMLLGQAIGAVDVGRFTPGALLVGALFTLLDLVFVVLLNDWADRDIDAVKRRLFPSAGSPKTIPDGLLPASTVLTAALMAGVLAVIVAVVGATWLHRPWLSVGAVAALGLFIVYSLPPLALNYRGGGELLEALGVGLVLPWLNAYAQSGVVATPGLAWFAGFSLLSFASAVASGLSDEESDRVGGKRTFTTLLGNQRARRLAEGSTALGIVLWVSIPLACGVDHAAWAALPAASVSGYHTVRLLAASPAAVTRAFAAHRAYKHRLHLAIWHGAAVLSAGLVTARFALH